MNKLNATASGSRLMSLAEVVAMTTLSRAAIYHRVRRGSFPKQVKLSLRRVAWRASEVQDWIGSLAQAELREEPIALKRSERPVIMQAPLARASLIGVIPDEYKYIQSGCFLTASDMSRIYGLKKHQLPAAVAKGLIPAPKKVKSYFGLDHAQPRNLWPIEHIRRHVAEQAAKDGVAL